MRDERILKKLNDGDAAGLEGLMDAYGRYVSAVVFQILRFSMQAEDMEEVASDVFLTAWTHRADMRPGKIKAWLGAVARHKAKNKLRERGSALPLEEDALEWPDPADLAAESERGEERELVRRAVDALSPQDREIFLRHYYYAQTVEEVSAAMDMNPSTVKTRLRRGREKLKEVLTRGGVLNEA